ncbi:zeta toxin family protein [Nocardia asiatica]|uniref:zeta toxin family protein n=1 Tax=Nocardia asiatica TaxID=209252 RepID=UPI00030C289F|nr:zeta toxin family protein [Nocardia asiatica]
MTAPLPEGQLPLEENRRIFTEEIVPAYLASMTPRSTPVAVMIVGQTGAGKTAITALIRETLERNNRRVAWINMDFYNPFHPDYNRWQSERPTEADQLVRPDGELWWRQAQDYALARHADILLESAAASPAEFEDICRRIQDAELPAGVTPYRIEAVFVAVHGALSEYGVLARYTDQVLRRGHGQRISSETHEISRRGVQRAAAFFEEGLGHFAAVVRRNALAVYMTSIPVGGIVHEHERRLVAEIQRAQQQPLPPDEAFAFATQLAVTILRAPREILPALHRVAHEAIPLLPGEPRVWRQLVAHAENLRAQIPGDNPVSPWRQMSTAELTERLTVTLANWADTTNGPAQHRATSMVTGLLTEIARRSHSAERLDTVAEHTASSTNDAAAREPQSAALLAAVSAAVAALPVAALPPGQESHDQPTAQPTIVEADNGEGISAI